MRRALIPALLLLFVGLVLGLTVLREEVARAAPPILDVFVSNDSTHPVPVRDIGEKPVQMGLQWNFSAGSQGEAATYAVPAGKVLRIGFVSAHEVESDVEDIAVERFTIQTRVGGDGAGHGLLSAKQGENGTGDVISQSVEIYADSETTVTFLLNIAPHAFPARFSGSFSGVLVDAS